MTTPTNLERLSYSGPDGCIAGGLHRNIIQGSGATRTLLAKESGSMCLFDRAAGIVYTLPTPVEGMQFHFATVLSVTTNAYKTLTAAIATQFLVGAVAVGSIATATVGGFSADGTTIAAISSNGTTTGGLIGEFYSVVGISATKWQINGLLIGSGILATPFAVS